MSEEKNAGALMPLGVRCLVGTKQGIKTWGTRISGHEVLVERIHAHYTTTDRILQWELDLPADVRSKDSYPQDKEPLSIKCPKHDAGIGPCYCEPPEEEANPPKSTESTCSCGAVNPAYGPWHAEDCYNHVPF